MNKFLCVGIVLISAFSSCTYESVEPTKIEVKDTVVSYSKTIVPLLTTQCNLSGCHEGGSPDGDFTAYAGVKEKANGGSLYNRVVTLKDMPKAGFTLTDQERAYFAQWINQGALNN